MALSAVILCGGQGQRMGGLDKGLMPWRGRPMVAWMTELAAQFSDDLMISCNRHQREYQAYAPQVFSDAETGFPGPLAGITEALARARHERLLVLPCDAPMLPASAIVALLQSAVVAPNNPACLRRGAQLEPLMSLWPVSLRAALDAAWQQGQRSPRQFLVAQGVCPVDIRADAGAWQNLNTLEQLHDSERDAHSPG